MGRMNAVVIGLTLIALSALMALVQRRWSSPAILGVVAGVALAGYGLWPQPAEPAVGTVLASDAAPARTQPAAAAPETPSPAAKAQETTDEVADAPMATEETAKPASEGGATEAEAPAVAPAIPEHVIPGATQDWVAEVKNLVEKPNHYPLAQSGDAPEDAPNRGDRIYEYIDIKLGGRTFQTVFLSKSPSDPEMWMVHIEPGAQGAPIQPEELGSVRILGEGGNFIVFLIEDGPFAGDYLIWATGGHRGGGEAIRIYSPKFLEREHGLAQQIAQAAGEGGAP